jgi:hypothetical protein
MLNLFQHPCAVICIKGDALGADDRAWTLKQVQGGRWVDDAIFARMFGTTA